MDEEEKYFPPIVYQHFTQKQEEAILEASGAMASLVCLATPADRWRALRLQKMGSASHAHVELPFVLMSMDVWATPSVKDEFMAKLSVAAK
jgi:hypothetical protein